ncbi:hypothetical protein AB0G83_15370 [Streptomyces klenkii]|uniref:hypothetical protein n=1 Tax=Streptomyces klenkii TaxID=1420899 RepID=UPI0033CBED9A
MSEQYEYFVKAAPPYTEDRPSGLWRRLGEQWDYLSLLDWEWHSVGEAGVQSPPSPQVLYPVSAERAAVLEADRQGWVRYWARYTDLQDWEEGELPTTVVRRRQSPDRVLDEAFLVGDTWGATRSIFDFFDPRPSSPPHLVEITPDEAEGLLQELRGVTGATEL